LFHPGQMGRQREDQLARPAVPDQRPSIARNRGQQQAIGTERRVIDQVVVPRAER
jgi:hypothetical protein